MQSNLIPPTPGLSDAPDTTMPLDVARRVRWPFDTREPMGALFDRGTLTCSKLQWAVEKATWPRGTPRGAAADRGARARTGAKAGAGYTSGHDLTGDKAIYATPAGICPACCAGLGRPTALRRAWWWPAST